MYFSNKQISKGPVFNLKAKKEMKYLKRQGKKPRNHNYLKCLMHRSMFILIEMRTYHACAGFEVFEGAIKAVSMVFIPELFSLVVIAIIFRCF